MIEKIKENLTREQINDLTSILEKQGFKVLRSGHIYLDMKIDEREIMQKSYALGYIGHDCASLVNINLAFIDTYHNKLKSIFNSV